MSTKARPDRRKVLGVKRWGNWKYCYYFDSLSLYDYHYSYSFTVSKWTKEGILKEAQDLKNKDHIENLKLALEEIYPGRG